MPHAPRKMPGRVSQKDARNSLGRATQLASHRVLEALVQGSMAGIGPRKKRRLLGLAVWKSGQADPGSQLFRAVKWVAWSTAARKEYRHSAVRRIRHHFLNKVLPADFLDVGDEKLRVPARCLWHEFLRLPVGY